MSTGYTAEQILESLDRADPKPGARPKFPVFDEAYVYFVDARLSAYRDDTAWAIVIERLGFNPRGVGHNGIRLDLYFYGTGVTLETDRWGFRHQALNVTSDGPDGPTFDGIEDVRPDVRSIRIRDTVVPVRTDEAHYAARGIDREAVSESHVADLLRSYERRLRSFIKHPPRRPVPDDARERFATQLREKLEKYRGEFDFRGHHLLRGLLPEYRQPLLATERERRNGLREGLPLFLQLDGWTHPDIMNRELPSETEAFQLLANAMAAGDPTLYRPTVRPNTNWHHWPEGGSL